MLDKKLTDQEKLAEIAKNDNYYVTTYRSTYGDSVEVWEADKGVAAVAKLTDQTIIADVAKNAKNGDVRRAAITRLNEQYQTLFADIAKNDIDYRVCTVAVCRLTDCDMLSDVQKNAKIPHVGVIARKILIEITTTERDINKENTNV